MDIGHFPRAQSPLRVTETLGALTDCPGDPIFRADASSSIMQILFPLYGGPHGSRADDEPNFFVGAIWSHTTGYVSLRQ